MLSGILKLDTKGVETSHSLTIKDTKGTDEGSDWSLGSMPNFRG